MMGLFLNDRTYEDDEGNEYPGPQYCEDALQDVTFYRLIKLTGWTPRQLEDEVSLHNAVRLLRADGAYSRAQQEADRRASPKK